MADIAQLENALVKADAAGNADDARVLAAEIRRMRSSSPEGDKLTLSKPTLGEKIQASIPGRLLQGARDPIDAGAQLLPRGLEAITSLGGLAPNPVSGFFGDQAKKVEALNRQNEQQYEAARTNTGQEGFDGARLIGNVASPVNAAVAAALPMKAGIGLLGKIGYGAKVGAVGGALQPVDNADGDFWQNKAAQAGMGAAFGAAATPIASKIGEALARRFSPNPEISGARSSLQTDQVISKFLDSIGQRVDDIPEQQMNMLRQQVNQSMKQGKVIDPAAILRKQDFDALSIPGTGGQITRDATQFARERNLRGVAGVGEPLMQRFEQQNQGLQKIIGNYGGGKASESQQAGQVLADALKSVDDKLNAGVRSAYQAARESAGKDLNVPLQGLAQDYAQVLDNFGDKIPSGVRNQFKALGFETGKQQKVFTIEDADKVLKVINANHSNDPATNNALGQLSKAVKKAVTDVSDDGGPFAPAVAAARQRFALHDAIPALEAAAKGSVNPDDFVNRFVINGKTDHVKALAKALQSQPEAYTEARNQIGAALQRAAFGENVAGDKLFAPERFAKALRQMGSEKLGAFFSPDEVAQMKTASRVASYINSQPTAAPVNHSNTAGAVMNLMGRLPGVPAGAALLNTAKNAIENQSVVSKALSENIPTSKAKLTPDQIRAMSRILGFVGAGSGAIPASELK